jgi:hypothetical protein
MACTVLSVTCKFTGASGAVNMHIYWCLWFWNVLFMSTTDSDCNTLTNLCEVITTSITSVSISKMIKWYLSIKMCGNMYKLHFIVLWFRVLYNRRIVHIINFTTHLNAACEILIILLYCIYCFFDLFQILLVIWLNLQSMECITCVCMYIFPLYFTDTVRVICVGII